MLAWSSAKMPVASLLKLQRAKIPAFALLLREPILFVIYHETSAIVHSCQQCFLVHCSVSSEKLGQEFCNEEMLV